jgi:hypothetical protein
MPEISLFFGIVIKMFFDDHNPPRFHAEYDSDLALIDILNLSLQGTVLPSRPLSSDVRRNQHNATSDRLN